MASTCKEMEMVGGEGGMEKARVQEQVNDPHSLSLVITLHNTTGTY